MKFSITIPAYKRKFLKECIDSCLAQTYDDYEVIIVNDHSPEDLDSIVNQYNDSRIRYYVNDKNCGAVNVVDNWNKCLEYAKGDYIICMGDDDRLLPCCLEEYAKLIEKYPGLSVYHAWTQLITENSDILTFQEQRPEYEYAYAFLWHRWTFRHWQYIGDFLYDTKHLREHEGFFKLPLAWGSDDITAFRAALDGGIANTQVPCFQYRVNGQTISSTGSSRLKLKANELAQQWYEEEFKKLKIEKLNTPQIQTEADQFFFALLIKKLPEYYRTRFFVTFTEGYPETIKDYKFWMNEAHKFGATPKNIIREIYNYYMKKWFRITQIY